MPLAEFSDYHRSALMRDEVRHNLMLAILDQHPGDGLPDIMTWTLGAPGQCAVKMPGRAIVLGDLSEAQCHQLAEATRDLDYPGVLGPDRTANWFVERAVRFGLRFGDMVDQQIHALADRPRYPGAPGSPRRVSAEDAPRFAEWVLAFLKEAVPHDPLPTREQLDRRAAEGGHWFWEVDGKPVSMAGVIRRTDRVAAIAPVYTPPAHRGCGYAGSVTAAVVESILAEGKDAACLYINLANRFSRRCYARIGFRHVCDFPLFLCAASEARSSP